MDYRQKTIRELRGLARAGDAGAQQTIAELGQAIRQALLPSIADAFRPAFEALAKALAGTPYYDIALAYGGDLAALERVARRMAKSDIFPSAALWLRLERQYQERREAYLARGEKSLTWDELKRDNVYQALTRFTEYTPIGDILSKLPAKTREMIIEDLHGAPLRKLAREDELKEDVAIIAALRETIEHNIQLRMALEGLPERERAALAAVAYGGDADKALAKRYGVKPSTVRGWRHNAIVKIRREFGAA